MALPVGEAFGGSSLLESLIMQRAISDSFVFSFAICYATNIMHIGIKAQHTTYSKVFAGGISISR
jgi:hypothetical protein